MWAAALLAIHHITVALNGYSICEGNAQQRTKLHVCVQSRVHAMLADCALLDLVPRISPCGRLFWLGFEYGSFV